MTTDHALYKTLWRWHFYAGLLCMPFIVLLSVTGAIYLFKPQIEAWREAPFKNLVTVDSPFSANQVIDFALHAIPDAKFMAYRLPQSRNDAIRISVRANEQVHYIYVHPSTGAVLTIKAKDKVFVEWVKDLHGELLAGQKGSLLVELVASWAILMVISGIYLALSKLERRWWTAFWPSSQDKKGRKLKKRTFLKELHTAIGLWVSVFTLFLLVSGLPWTTVWGGALKDIRAFTEKSSGPPAWRTTAVQHADLPTSVITRAEALNFPWPSELSVSNAKLNEWKLASTTQNRPKRITAWIIDGELKKVEPFKETPILSRMIGYGVAAHEGHLFGWINQLLGLITAAGIIALSITGFFMWYARKPQRGFAAPPATNRWPFVLLMPMLLLPMALLSFVAVLVLDFCVRRFQKPHLESDLGPGIG